jgi:2-polyprenyl-3-methyl-5-hydroxy-6-metoxy-1,4-benzoquinol methylase
MLTKTEIEAKINAMFNPAGGDRRIYQSIDVKDIHIEGRRGYKRVELMGGESLVGKSVLDLGCSFGMFCFDAARRGADYVLGVDSNAQHDGGFDIDFQDLKINSDEFYEYIGDRVFDVAYCFAIIEHIPDIARFWDFINRQVDLMFFDSNISKGRDTIEPILRENTTFEHIEYLGQSADTDPVPSFRVFYKCY